MCSRSRSLKHLPNVRVISVFNLTKRNEGYLKENTVSLKYTLKSSSVKIELYCLLRHTYVYLHR